MSAVSYDRMPGGMAGCQMGCHYIRCDGSTSAAMLECQVRWQDVRCDM